MGVDPRRIAGELERRLGSPSLGLVLGSGFARLSAALRPRERVAYAELPGLPAETVSGQGHGVAVVELDGARVWIFEGRFHLYEGLPAEVVVAPVSSLAAAGGRAILLTCACGGLREEHRPGELKLVSDHLNLTGVDPARCLQPPGSEPVFVDLQGAYDLRLRELWAAAGEAHGEVLGPAVLAALPGPCFETPAEVTMLRRLGADLATMSTVPEAIAARRLGLPVAAIACVANRGAGLDGPHPIEHRSVLQVVGRAVEGAEALLVDGVRRTLRSL